jgi:hypothetical protein
MSAHVSVKLVAVVVLGVAGSAFMFAQQAVQRAPQDQAQQRQGQGQARGGQGAGGGQGGARAAATVAPLFFKVEWVRPPSQNAQVPVIQENIVDSNVQLKQYGPAAKQLLTSGTPGSDTTPFTVWSGECAGPFAITFRQKNNYVDLTGLAKIRWVTKTSGFHVVRPVVKLADGTLLVGDLTALSVPMLVQSEFSLAGVHWIKLDPDRVVTLGMSGGVANEIWVNNPDLSKVDEVGFADLMPGSGHGTGGYIHLGQFEVYGKPVPREATISQQTPTGPAAQ